MAVKIRMTRIGRRHRPFFRINAVDSRTPRDGRVLEKLGHYDPIEKDVEKQLVIDVERTKDWLSKGAIPSETVSELLSRVGIHDKHAEKRKKRRENAREIARKKGVPFTQAEKKAAAEAAEKAKAEAEAKAKAEAEAKEKAETEAKAKAEAEAEEAAGAGSEEKSE